MKIVSYIAMISIIMFVARDQLAVISGSQLRGIFADTSTHVNAVIMVLELITFSATGLYDLVASKHTGMEVSPYETLKIGWIAQTFNNLTGFDGLIGGTARAKYYAWTSTDRDRSTGVPVSVWATNLLGLFVLSAITLSYMVHLDGWLIIVAVTSCIYLSPLFLADRLKRLFRF